MTERISYIFLILTVFSFSEDKTVLGELQGYHYPEAYYENYICLKNKKGVDYRGTVSHTVNTIKMPDVMVSTSGKPCIPWDKYVAGGHSYNQQTYPKYGLDRTACRNPGGSGKTVWCYTANYEAKRKGSTFWGYCKVPLCSQKLSDVNIAAGKMAWQSSTYKKQSAHLATNGIMSNILKNGEQCSLTDSDGPSWLMVDLEAHFAVEKVVVHNRKCDKAKECAGRLAHFKVSVGNVFFLETHRADFRKLVPQYYALCRFVDLEVYNGADEVITCNMRGGRYPVGRFVVLAENHGYMSICQLQVFGAFAGNNVAKGKLAYQSLTYKQQVASLATNGIVSSRFQWTEPKQCAVSAAINNVNWFAVSLQDFQRFPYGMVTNYIIEDVFLLNMGDRRMTGCHHGFACDGYLTSFEVSVGLDFFKEKLRHPNTVVEKSFGKGLIPSQFTVCAKPNPNFKVGPGEEAIVHCNGVEGRYVVVATRNEYLTICQIQVLGLRKKILF